MIVIESSFICGFSGYSRLFTYGDLFKMNEGDTRQF
jgi:hypothetical protein